MKTPKSYLDNLQNHIITKQMLLDCLYSSNKRAKNWRDKEQEIRDDTRLKQSYNHYYYDKYHNEENARTKKETYYKQKEIMLSLLTPVCIHRELYGYERRRIYDYENDYKKYKKEFVWENEFYDRDNEMWISFGDIELKDNPKYHYYLFYDIGDKHTFHTPINKEDVAAYVNKYQIQIVDIDQLETFGKDVNDLISNQFVSKLIKLVESGNYTYIS